MPRVHKHFFNQQLSWLEFNQRVLELATDPEVPLLERLKFLCISSTNLDETFEIRIARLQQELKLGTPSISHDGMTPLEQLRIISTRAHQFVDDQYRILNDILFPQLAEQGIIFVRRTDWNDAQKKWVKTYFDENVLPVLSPIGIDLAHPFPRIINKSLNFVVSLTGDDAFGRDSGRAVVQAPRCLPRVIEMPAHLCDMPHPYVFLSSIIHAHVDDLFAGMTVTGCYQFRVTRNSELFVAEDEVEDLRHALENELFTRNYGDAVRLEVADNCPPETAQFLLDHFNLSEQDLYQVNGPVNLNRLMMIPSEVERPNLKYPAFVPGFPEPLSRQSTDIFETIRQQDILLHHPYQSFNPVIDFIRQAANDPDVLAIKHTLYRTGASSPIAEALEFAARQGKEVTAVIELRARFDEASNIEIAQRLQQAGAHVLYGVLGHKTHAKMCLIIRRESDKLQRYAHLSTGNYHPKTARLYTDFGLLTAHDNICQDIHILFQQLTGLGQAQKLSKLLQAPFTLQKSLLKLIKYESDIAKQGRPAKIIAKMNALTEPKLIKALYKASQNGVQIDLIVRGKCSLRPGIDGVSENIRVRSILGRFLEHHRVYYFHHDGQEKLYCASADWMPRNMHRRVEIAFPIETPELRERVIQEGLTQYLNDNANAWELQSDGRYRRCQPEEGQKAIHAQQKLLKKLAESPPLF